MKHRPKIDKSALRFGETVRTREPAYIAWLHTQPCVVRGQRGEVVVHHPRAIIPEPRAKGRKCSDRFAVSLLARYHINGGADSVHGRLGEARWWAIAWRGSHGRHCAVTGSVGAARVLRPEPGSIGCRWVCVVRRRPVRSPGKPDDHDAA